MLYCDSPNVHSEVPSHKFLIIEDSEFFNKTIYNYLSKNQNYQLDQALNFQDAKKLLQETSYDFILLDLNLPDAYGEDLVLEIKSLTQAKIIVLTAEEDIQMRESLFKNGILDYLVKDENFSFSLKAIEHIVENVTKNKNHSLLVIDDSMFMCKQLQKLLQVRNYTVEVALTAKEGLKLLQTNNISSIILDMELPDKHGLDLLREIKNMQEFCHIPIIIISGIYNPEVVRTSLKIGASDFIKKPFNIEEFTLKVDAAVESNRKYTEILCTKKMLQEYKIAIDDSSLVSKTDLKGIITYVNDEFSRISGYQPEELIGKSYTIVRHPDMPDSIFNEMWQTIQAKKSWKGVIKNRRKDGSAYSVKSVVNPIIDLDGNIVEYIAIRTDITELETYKEVLKNDLHTSDNNLLLFKQREDAMAKFAAVIKTDANNTIIYANNKFTHLSGYEQEELLGQDCSILFTKRHQRKKDCIKLKNELSEFKTLHMQLEHQTKKGKKYITDTMVAPVFNEESEVIEHIYLMYDVTEMINAHQEIENTQKEIIYRLGEVGESRSQETGNHVKRVAEYSRLLALLAGLGETNANLLYAASPMHDIGKIGIPDAILNKPGRLTDEEFEIMKEHSKIGYNILTKSKRPILKAAALVSYLHHEKYNGTGYPRGIKGEKIHIFGRITAIADVFDALGSNRVYKKAWNLERILELFKNEKGKHFDPQLIELFMNNLDKFLHIRAKFKDE